MNCTSLSKPFTCSCQCIYMSSHLNSFTNSSSKLFLFFCFCIIGKCSPQTWTEVSHCSNRTYFSWGKREAMESGQSIRNVLISPIRNVLLLLTLCLTVSTCCLFLHSCFIDLWTVSAFYFFTHATSKQKGL